MNKKQTTMLAMAGLALIAGSQAQAASTSNLSYSDNDLLLNFRDAVDDSGSDVTVDLGNVNTFLSTVNGLSGSYAVLDSGTGYNTSAFTTQFSGATLISTVAPLTASGDGTADIIAMSAAAENLQASGAAGNTLWLTRQITAGQLATGGTPSAQAGSTSQRNTAIRIQNIGYEAESSANGGTGTRFTGALNGGVVNDSDSASYHTQAQSPSSVDVINFNGTVINTATSPVEAMAGSYDVNSGTGTAATIYEALWMVPQSGNGTPVYEGYFTLNGSNGEVDFHGTGAVPEPSTYAMFAAAGLLALAYRRQLRALVA